MQGEDGDTRKFTAHEIVWAKVTGYSWWPAKVSSATENTNGYYRVEFFGDSTHALLRPNKIVPYEEMREDMEQKNKKLSKSLMRAILLADKEVSTSDTEEQQPLEQQQPQQTVNTIEPFEHQIDNDSCSLMKSTASERPKQLTRQEQINNLLDKYELRDLPKRPLKTKPIQKSVEETEVEIGIQNVAMKLYAVIKHHSSGFYSRQELRAIAWRHAQEVLRDPKELRSFKLRRIVNYIQSQSIEICTEQSNEKKSPITSAELPAELDSIICE